VDVTRGALVEQIRQTLGELVRAVGVAVLVLFLVLLRIAVVAVRLFPFVLRVASLLFWAVGLLELLRSVYGLYVQFSDHVAATLTALGLAGFCIAIPIAFTMKAKEWNDSYIAWGAFAAGAIVAFALKAICDYTVSQPQLHWIASITPPVLVGSFILMAAISQIERRNDGHREEKRQGQPA
jgi:hypothetical protein